MWPVQGRGRPSRPLEGRRGVGVAGREGGRRLVGRLNRGSPQCLSALILHSVRSHGQTNRPRRNKGVRGEGRRSSQTPAEAEETSRSGSHNVSLQILPSCLHLASFRPGSPSFHRSSPSPSPSPSASS